LQVAALQVVIQEFLVQAAEAAAQEDSITGECLAVLHQLHQQKVIQEVALAVVEILEQMALLEVTAEMEFLAAVVDNLQ
jgi:hypothetical protein